MSNPLFPLRYPINPDHYHFRQFDKSKGIFTTKQPKIVNPNAIEVIDISEDCYIEIFHKHNAYTYDIMEKDYDNYFGMYYWVPAINTISSGLYDTKDNAIQSAIEALKIQKFVMTIVIKLPEGFSFQGV